MEATAGGAGFVVGGWGGRRTTPSLSRWCVFFGGGWLFFLGGRKNLRINQKKVHLGKHIGKLAFFLSQLDVLVLE